MDPDPTFAFTIPSVHDYTTLECRLYSPAPSYFLQENDDHPRIVGGAVIAHPYASFGGCYDDHVVLALVTELLQQGLVVGTFNFRYRHCEITSLRPRADASAVSEVQVVQKEEPVGHQSPKSMIMSPILVS